MTSLLERPAEPTSSATNERLVSVLFVHNTYRERGGEDAVFEAESELLEERGHRVKRLLFDNDDLPDAPSLGESLRIARDTVWSRKGRERLGVAMELYKPDVVHFHNTFPQVSPAAYGVAREAGAAVVQTLHNFRLVCPSGLLFRDGAPCESCVGHAMALPGVLHACYRGSRKQTAAAAAMLTAHRLRGTWKRDVDAYIAPSAFLRDKMIEGGLPGERIHVKPNFVAEDPGAKPEPGGRHALFVGRLTASKGIETLLDAYAKRRDLPELHIVGDGELADAVRTAAAADGRIVYRGWLDKAGVLTEMGSAGCLVMPSLWYENFPMTIVEAFARGLPVVASRLGALPEIVGEGRTGLLFDAGNSDDLADRLTEMLSDRLRLFVMGFAARGEYLTHYDEQHAYAGLLEVYDKALTARS